MRGDYHTEMKFSVLQLLIATSIVGAILGIAVRDGMVVAGWLTFFATLFAVCVVRARYRWSSATGLQKLYAVTASTASGLLLAVVIYSVATSSTLANERSTRNLQTALLQDPRFAAVRVNYFDRKTVAVWVEGTVPKECDFQELRQRLLQKDWRNIDDIHWLVYVSDSKRTYNGWDKDYFDEANIKPAIVGAAHPTSPVPAR